MEPCIQCNASGVVATTGARVDVPKFFRVGAGVFKPETEGESESENCDSTYLCSVLSEIFHVMVSLLVVLLSKINIQNCQYFCFLSTYFGNLFSNYVKDVWTSVEINFFCLLNTARSSGKKHEKMVLAQI